MNAPRIQSAVVGVALVLGAGACGHKGPPLPPLRPIPTSVSGFSIERAGPAVTLRFVVPDANVDGSTPPAVQRIDIYGLSLPADAPPPTPAELTLPANLIRSVQVRMPDPDPPAPQTGVSTATTAASTKTTVPAPGDATTFVDTIATATTASAALVRYYAVVPVAGRRKGPPSPILRVPVASAPEAPAGIKVDYGESKMTITWAAGAAGQKFVIDETDEAGAHPKRLSDSPLDANTFELPFQFGKTRCFTVRAIDSRGAVSIVGEPAAPVCVTPVDHFKPDAPTSFEAVPGDGAVELIWTASSAPDVAGYIVLRGEGANGTLQPLTAEPITATSYKDQTARPGVTYEYAVRAVDTATPRNESELSNRKVVTARQPSLHARHGG